MRKATMGAAYLAEGGKSGWWRRLAWNAPAPTILGMPDHSSTALIHPDELRCLSVTECAAIQTFPSFVRFAGSSRSQYQQIGNAVPVLLARALGDHLRDFLDGARMAPPAPPPWRQSSANRRIGTHGWVVPTDDNPLYHLNVQVRPDHIWAREHKVAVIG
jgi:DNA (cytosine-5)-methyltransferase 1